MSSSYNWWVFCGSRVVEKNRREKKSWLRTNAQWRVLPTMALSRECVIHASTDASLPWFYFFLLRQASIFFIFFFHFS